MSPKRALTRNYLNGCAPRPGLEPMQSFKTGHFAAVHCFMSSRRLKCFINHRPAGPGGASLRYTARIGITGLTLLGIWMRTTRNLPLFTRGQRMLRCDDGDQW